MAEKDSGLDPRTLQTWAHINKSQRPRRTTVKEKELDPALIKALRLDLMEERCAPAGRDYGALCEAFESTMPATIKSALILNSGDSGSVSMPPEAQWLFTLMSAWSTSSTKSGNNCCRFSFQDRDHRELLIVDVREVLQCPEVVPHGPTRVAEQSTAVKKGGRVVICGLVSRKDLNGARGTVRSINHETMRYCVELDSSAGGGGNTFNVKRENIESDIDSEIQDDSFINNGPLVLVRFLHQAAPNLSAQASRGPIEYFSKSYRDGWLREGGLRAGSSGCFAIMAESVDDVRAGLAELERHSALLSDAYRAHFQSLSPHHRGAGGACFRPSFLVPPHHVPEYNPLAKLPYSCANPDCRAEAIDAKRFTKCSRCESALYCGKDCQKSHWGKHKVVCGKTADELERSLAAADAGRESFVFPIDCCPEGLRSFPPGWIREEKRREIYRIMAETGEDIHGYSGNINFRQKVKKINVTEDEPMPKNIYGDDEFVVKIQVPMDAKGESADGNNCGGLPDLPARCMIYDRRKTFGDQYFDCDTPEKRRAFVMVRTYGPGERLKAYFAARRQGTNVRVYTDRVLPVPSPPW